MRGSASGGVFFSAWIGEFWWAFEVSEVESSRFGGGRALAQVLPFSLLEGLKMRLSFGGRTRGCRRVFGFSQETGDAETLKGLSRGLFIHLTK